MAISSLRGSVLPADGQLAYSVKLAAKVLDLGTRKVEQLIANGGIASFTEGRSRRITRWALEEYCRRKEAETA
ncbi:excisionase family DNA-binding protein [Actinoplanes regularis]|nr:excisionase family DNA-binding protein [Actinoplanes regularis]